MKKRIDYGVVKKCENVRVYVCERERDREFMYVRERGIESLCM